MTVQTFRIYLDWFPQLFYQRKVPPDLDERKEEVKDCVLTVEDLINYSDQITEQSETKEGYSLNSSIEFEFTPLHLEVIVIGPLY